MQFKITTIGFVFLCAAQLGCLWAVFANTPALAEEPGEVPQAEEAAPNTRFSVKCKGFHSDLGKSEPPAIDTSDRLTEVGQWVGNHEDLGMSLHSVDFEVGQKTTNYPQGWVYVCMARGSGNQ